MNQNQTSTNEAQIREVVESWATAARNKDMEPERCTERKYVGYTT